MRRAASRRSLAAALLLAVAAAAAAEGDADRHTPCVACHGAGGVSTLAETPSLAGQHAFYAATQLFLFREGRRGNEAMSAVAKGMSDADLRAFSDWIGRLPPAAAAPPADAADPARTARAAGLARRALCASCHGASYAGERQVPRLAGQREDYLLKTLAEFKAGRRIGYTPAMNEALAGVAEAELADLAWYLARFDAGGR